MTQVDSDLKHAEQLVVEQVARKPGIKPGELFEALCDLASKFDLRRAFWSLISREVIHTGTGRFFRSSEYDIHLNDAEPPTTNLSNHF